MCYFMLQILLITTLFLVLGWLGLSCALLLAQYFMKRPPTIHTLFIDLKPKLWMTAGVGIFFFSLYGCLILLFSFFMNQEVRQSLFSMALRHPTYFIYGGLSIFVTISLSILVVRSFIKHIYNSKR